MEHYKLKEDEVILYHGTAEILPDGKTPKPARSKKTETEVILTNTNFVFITTEKRLLRKDDVTTEVFPISDVKSYKDSPHIVLKGKTVEIYFSESERFIKFAKGKNAGKFADTAMRLISGKSKFVRAVRKTQNEIKETNKKLNIDIVGGVKAAAGVAAEVAIAASGGKNAKTITKIAGLAVQKWRERNKNSEKPSLPEPVGRDREND